MACYHPIQAYRATQGGGIVFSRSGGYRDLPLTLSCGQCWGCRLERSRQWAVRCTHEAQMHERKSFLTLTYDDDHLPPLSSLDVSHWQDFAKRTRKKMGAFRFFHCGEYGDETKRPHYHAIVYGLDFAHDRKLFKTTKQGDRLYNSQTLSDLWGHGHAVIGDVTFESAAYVARYIMKKVTGDLAEAHYFVRLDEKTGEVLSRKPEYTTMSRNPGIGKTWIDKYMKDVYPSDEIIMNGKRFAPPKFYDQQYEKINPEGFKTLKALRAKEGDKHTDNQTYTRLEVRDQVAKAKIKHLKRTL